MTVPYAFGAATTAIPLSQLDSNFNTTITLGNTAIQLGNTVTTLNNMTLANVTISSGNVTLTNVTVTTANATTVNTTTLIATTANVTTINATDINVAANVTLNGGTANGVAYLNGSKVLTTGSALTFDGTNLSVVNAGSAGVNVQSLQSYLTLKSTGAFNPFINFFSSTSTLEAQIQGVAGGGSLVFALGAGATEQMRLTSTGLGIGITNPANKLVVSNAGANGLEVNPISGVSSGASLNGYNRSTSAFTPLTYTALAHYFQVGSSPTTAATLDSSGNLGLGVTPSAWASNARALQIDTYSALFESAVGRTTLTFNARESATNTYNYLQTEAASAYQQVSGQHIWYTAPSGTAGDPITFIQAMTLDASGNLLVQSTSSSVTSSVGHKIRPDAAAPFMATVGSSTSGGDVTYSLYSTGAAAYRFYVGYNGTISATTTTISGISDVRLKENIRDLDDGLAAVMALKPRKFDWKAGKGKGIKDDRGFIAQEFEQVFPDMIDEWKDPAPEGEEPYKAVNANLIPTLVKAIQELKAEFDAYKATHP